MYRDTVFTIIVYPEMYRDTIFMIEIYPDMNHDTVSLSVSSRLSCVLCFCGCTRASLLLFGLSNTRVSPDAFSRDSLSKVFNVETSQLEGNPCREWNSVLLRSAQLSLLELTRWRPWLSFPCYRPGWKYGILAVCTWTSRGMKANEPADLTTSEFVSEYPEENPSIVWSGPKHLETHEYINEPLDQVKPDSCFQPSDEGPSLFFLLLLCVDFNQS